MKFVCMIIGLILMLNEPVHPFNVIVGFLILAVGLIFGLIEYLKGKNFNWEIFSQESAEEEDDELTDLEKLRGTFDDLEISYHELYDGDHIYIQKMGVHDEEGFIFSLEHDLVPLKNATQLTNFFEFDIEGTLVSW